MKRILNYRQIINRRHPLNRGLVSEWVCLPGLAGGKYLFDIAGQNHGTLTNVPTWSGPGGRPGGFGSLGFDGTDDYVSIPTIDLRAVTPRTIIFSVRFLSTVDGVILGGGAPGYYPYIDTTAIYNRGTAGGPNSVAHGGISAGDWYRIGLATDGSTVSVYKNGKLLGTMGDTQPIVSALGAFSDSTSNNLEGNLDAILHYSRKLSDAEMASDFAESRAGNPNRYNWLRLENASGIEYVTKTVPLGINYSQYFNFQYTTQR